MRRARPLLPLLLAGAGVGAWAGPAGAQTMLDQEQRLIDIHSLLLDLPPVGAPGAYRAGQVSLGLELITIPPIDGTTGGKRQITASDRTPVFPRPRLAIGLPAPEGFRAFAGIAYIPPVSFDEVSSHYGAVEAGMAWVPGALRAGLRGHVLYAESKSPVTEPGTRDTLDTFELGADLTVGYRLAAGPGSLTPYAGVGVVRLDSTFRVTRDGVELESRYTGLSLQAGLRLLLAERWELVGELDAFPGRLVHPSFRVGYVLDLGGG